MLGGGVGFETRSSWGSVDSNEKFLQMRDFNIPSTSTPGRGRTGALRNDDPTSTTVLLAIRTFAVASHGRQFVQRFQLVVHLLQLGLLQTHLQLFSVFHLTEGFGQISFQVFRALFTLEMDNSTLLYLMPQMRIVHFFQFAQL